MEKRLAERITNSECTHMHNEVRAKHTLGTICTTYGSDSYDNAELIAEAFNITNQTGLSPKELMEQRDEAADLISKILASFALERVERFDLNDLAKDFLKKVNQ